MERDKLDEIINKLNNLLETWTIQEIGNVYDQIGAKILENIEIYFREDEDIIFKDLFSNLEVKLNPESTKYLYDKIQGEILHLLSDDKLKLKQLDRLDIYDKVEVIASLNDDNKKLELLELDEIKNNEYFKVQIISSLNDDNKKLELLDSIEGELERNKIICSIKDDEFKMNLIDSKEISGILKTDIIVSLQNDKNKFKYLEAYSGEELHILYSIKDDKTRIELIEDPKYKNLKQLIILTFKDEKNKIEYLDELDSEWEQVQVIESLKNEEDIEKLLESKLKNGGKEIVLAYRKYVSEDKLIKNIEFFMKKDGVTDNFEKKKNILIRLKEENEDVLRTINFAMLEDKYINILGLDKINQFSCYPQIQEDLLKLNDEQLNLFSKCIENYQQNGQTDEWTPLAEAILKNINQYDELIENIKKSENVDIEKVTRIIQGKNVFGIKTLEDIKKYDLIREEKCDEWINQDDIDKKRLAILEKIYGHDIDYTRRMILKYGENIDDLPNSDCKNYILSLKEIMDIEDGQILNKIYEELKQTKNVDINKTMIERNLKTEYWKLYSGDLFKVENAKEVDKGVYEAGTDFKMIITSLGAFHSGNIENYEKSWNRPSIACQHFCASYIRNDMIGTAPIYNICYRLFSNVK